MSDKTLEFYNSNAHSYFDKTVGLDVSGFRDIFVGLVNPGGKILDFGCGSGRDSKYFTDSGFNVVALDGSSELCKLASDYIEQEVICQDFRNFKAHSKFDGIWACSSLLHLRDFELLSVLGELRDSLVDDGTLYMSFKLGNFEGYKDGRYFRYLNKQEILKVIHELKLNVIELNITKGGLKETQLWMSIFLSK